MKAISEILIAFSVMLFMASLIMWSSILLVIAFTVMFIGTTSLCKAVSKEEDY